MAFNIKINAYAGGSIITLLNKQNCSSITLEKTEVLNEEELSNAVLVDDLYKIKCTVKLETGVEEEIDIRKTHFEGQSIYFLSKICVCDSSSGEIITTENLFSKDSIEYTLTKNTELKCIYESKIPVCVNVNNKYYGDPFILYGDEFNNTQMVKELSIADDYVKFWICENKTSYEAVNFNYWEVNIHEIVFDTDGNYSDNVVNRGNIYKGDSKLITLAAATFNLDVNNSDINLYLVRNENVLSLKNLKKSSIYSTFAGYIAAINTRIKELKSKPETANTEAIGYYLELKAYYEPNNVPITVFKRNGTLPYSVEYKFGSDIANQSLDVPKKGGYVFDGYYINPKVNDVGLDEVPEDDDTLSSSNHVRVTNNLGKFVKDATKFLQDYDYINPVAYKFVKANYKPKITTITLDWQIPNSPGPEADKLIDVKFKQNISNIKIDIPTVTEQQNGVDVKFKFMGFYTQKGGKGDKVIKPDGKFRTDLLGYTSAGVWRWNKNLTSDDSMTLYADWKAGSYIELDKVGGTGGSNSFTVKYEEDMSNHDLYIPIRYVDPTDTKSDKLIFNGYWVDDYNTRVTRDDGVFKSNRTRQDGTKLTNLRKWWLLQEPITLYAYWYSSVYMAYANSNIDKCTATINGKKKNKGDKVRVGHSVKLTVSYDKLRYNFKGWKVNDNTYYFNTNETVEKTVALGDVDSINNRIDYNANFEHRKYIVYFKDLDGTRYGTLSFYYDSYCTALVRPQKIGHNFVGWFSDTALTNQVTYINEGNGGNEKGIANTTLTSKGTVQEISLYAKWQKMELEGKYILNPGKGNWKTGVTPPPQEGTTVSFGSIMEQLNKNLIPERDGYSFTGYYDENSRLVINKKGGWKKNTYYVDKDGKSIMTDENVFTAKFQKIIDFDDGFFQTFKKELNSNITAHSNIDFKKSIENKIATTNWINKAIGIPEINYYEDLIKNFYNNGIEESYNSDKGLADKYFFNDFNIPDNKLLKQSDIIDFFNNSATKLLNTFYLKDITYDGENDKTIMHVNFIENNVPIYPEGYSGSKDTIIYFTINDDKSVVYKLNIDEIKGVQKYEATLQYFDIEFPHLTNNINKITIEHIPCFAINNLNNTRTYYKPYIVFNKFKELNLTIEENTLLDNTKIKEYESDSLMVPVSPEIPVYPGGGSIVV